MSRKHVVEIEVRGCALVMGDVHGNLDVLNFAAHFARFDLGDELIIAGDLCDRGPNSLGVFEKIQQVNRRYQRTVIHVVRGNHEDALINAVRFLRGVDSGEDYRWEIKEKNYRSVPGEMRGFLT
jgi:predicted phosphodiesterase